MPADANTGSTGNRSVLADGGAIAVILAVWGFFAFLGAGIGEIGSSGGFFTSLGRHLYWLFIFTGFGNALLYIMQRAVVKAQ